MVIERAPGGESVGASAPATRRDAKGLCDVLKQGNAALSAQRRDRGDLLLPATHEMRNDHCAGVRCEPLGYGVGPELQVVVERQKTWHQTSAANARPIGKPTECRNQHLATWLEV